MKEVTIEITNNCPFECDYCSSNSIDGGKHLDTNVIMKFLDKQDSEAVGRINISGGEPLSHPDFYKILKKCWSITKNVWVYTNVLNQIIFNTDIIEEIKVEANVCIVAGRRSYIPKNVNRVHLLKLIKQGRAKDFDDSNITVSGNFATGSSCETCNHILLQADGKVVESPCKKCYGEDKCQ